MVEYMPRPEYPRPQMVRDAWMNLNGEWDFAFDFGRSGRARGMAADGVNAGGAGMDCFAATIAARNDGTAGGATTNGASDTAASDVSDVAADSVNAGGASGSAAGGAALYDKTIIVPFCPESTLSGIGYKDFIPSAWYRRSFNLTAGQLSGRVLLHFGAVDYFSEVWVNGVSAGTHKGGYSSFAFDITEISRAGENVVVVCAEDDNRSGRQPRGKQCPEYWSKACDYTRTTGIWQTVWLEFAPGTYIQSYKFVPDPQNSKIHLNVNVSGCPRDVTVKAEASFGGVRAGGASAKAGQGGAYLELPLDFVKLWDVGQPNLYDLRIALIRGAETGGETKNAESGRAAGGAGMDCFAAEIAARNDGAAGGAGMDCFAAETAARNDGAAGGAGMDCFAVEMPLFMRLVLDQGFYPDGIYAAPTDAALKKDIELSMELGFNGARLHEKVFEERFLYHADRAGYLVWGEMANWGLDISTPAGLEAFLPEWMETLERDFNHPSIIGWCPFNETGSAPNGARQDGDVLRIVYNVTKAADKTRPVIDTSGYIHVATDIFDIHWYEQNLDIFKEKFGAMKPGGSVFDPRENDQVYCGQPFFVSEYGGTWWNKPVDITAKNCEDAAAETAAGRGKKDGQNRNVNWGYGERPESESEFVARYVGMTKTLLENQSICGFCYTQLYDVEQEQNGLYTYARSKKFTDAAYDEITSCNRSAAAIERGGGQS